MNIIIFGPQGSGKGTQARLLCERFNMFYFESGAYLRRIAEKFPELKKWMNQGVLVPDKEMTSYLTAYLDQEHIYDDILFDGFPRNVDQYIFLKNWLDEKKVKIDLAIVLKISPEETVRRLESRRFDPLTGKVYNLVTDKPPADIDINRLVQREDDKPEVIRKRLEIYYTKTVELIAEVGKEAKIFEVDGERSIDVIQKDLVKIIESLQK